MATATFSFAELFYFAPSLILSGDRYLKTFSPDQLQTLTLLSFNIYSTGGNIFNVHYGIASLILGYLIFRSSYIPRGARSAGIGLAVRRDVPTDVLGDLTFSSSAESRNSSGQSCRSASSSQRASVTVAHQPKVCRAFCRPSAELDACNGARAGLRRAILGGAMSRAPSALVLSMRLAR
jgi:hypothetical protein